jgi:cell division transport system permease protein
MYSIREGLAGFKRARLAVVAATSAMVVVLVLIGIFALLGYQGHQVSSWLRQRVGEMELFLGSIDETDARTLQERVSSRKAVAEATYISQDEAEAIFAREFGEGSDIFLDEQFLPASIRVRLEPGYATPDSLSQMAVEFEQWTGVEDVVFNQPLLVKVQRNLWFATAVGGGLAGLVFLAGIFLIANTIRLTIYARRLLIRTMKLVGATDAFIRRPFLIEGVFQGFIAGVVATFVVWGGYRLLEDYLVQLAALQWPGGSPLILALGLIPVGVILGYIGSWMAARRFIRDVALH